MLLPFGERALDASCAKQARVSGRKTAPHWRKSPNLRRRFLISSIFSERCVEAINLWWVIAAAGSLPWGGFAPTCAKFVSWDCKAPGRLFRYCRARSRTSFSPQPEIPSSPPSPGYLVPATDIHSGFRETPPARRPSHTSAPLIAKCAGAPAASVPGEPDGGETRRNSEHRGVHFLGALIDTT